MAESTRSVTRFFPFPFRPTPPERAARAPDPALPRGREPAARSVGQLLESMLLRGPAAATGAELDEARYAPQLERITDAERVQARLRALAAREATAWVRSTGTTWKGRLLPAFDDGPYPLRLALDGPAPEAPFTLDVEGYGGLHRFEVPRVVRIGEALGLPLPDAIEQIHRRRARRAPAPAGMFATFRHPAFPELVLRRAVQDLSRTGLRVELRLEHDHLAPGLKLHDVEITSPTGAKVTLDATVRTLHAPRGGRAAGAGLELRPTSPDQAARWEQVVGDVLTPTTQLGGVWSEDAWELYAESGYFGLSGKSQAHFAALKAPFAAATSRIDAAPQVGCQVAWPSERGIEASLSMLKPYAGTWFGFQMAKRPGDAPDGTPGKDVLRDIHLRAYEHAAADPDLRWLWGIVQDAAKWSKLVHHDLPRRYVDSGRACIYPFHALELDVVERRAEQAGPAVSPASAEDEATFLAHLVRHRPEAYREAFDLVPERFALGALRGAWERAGLTRERALLVVREEGRPAAVALVESADPGLHLFNLLDVVRLYALAPGGEASFRALLLAASDWFLARGRGSFTCLLEEGTPRCVEGLPHRDLGRASHTLLPAELLPSLLEHVHEVTAPKLPRP